MTLPELKSVISQYQYFEDSSIIDWSCACMIANLLKLGDPVWAIIIGASSGGKSQMLRPLSLTNPKIIKRIDDLTENTFLSGMGQRKGEDSTPSLLHQIGVHGMLVISDMTVLFSKQKESRATILSQFRMLYDGEMTKYVGTSAKPLFWKGYLGIMAGSTPSIYHHFEEVADMGERFIYWRMHEYSAEKATDMAMKRTMYGKELDDILSEAYKTYLKDTIQAWTSGVSGIELPESIRQQITRLAIFAEKARTTLAMDFRQANVIRIPVPAMPMRVSLQLSAIAKALYVMRGGQWLDSDMKIIGWCAWSLANEEKRSILTILSKLSTGVTASSSLVADKLGLGTTITGQLLQNLAAVGILKRSGVGNNLVWQITTPEDKELIRSLAGITEDVDMSDEERALSLEEQDDAESLFELETFTNDIKM